MIKINRLVKNQTLQRALIAFIIASIFFYFGRKSAPEKVKIKEIIKYENQKKEDKQINNNKNVRIIEIVDKDGNRKKITDITDKSQINTKIEDKTSYYSEKKTEISNKIPQWQLGIFGGGKIGSFNPNVQGGYVNRRILGPIFVGAYGRTDKEIGLTLGLEF